MLMRRRLDGLAIQRGSGVRRLDLEDGRRSSINLTFNNQPMGRKSKNQFNNQLEDRPAGDSTTNLKVDAGTISESKATATTGERPTSCGDGDDGP